MKTILTLILVLFSTIITNANVLYAYGKVNSVGTNPLIKVNDAVYFVISYNTSNVITQADVTVDRSELHILRQNETPTSHVVIDENPADGTVQWAVLDSGIFSMDVATNTPGGVIPCIDSFDLGRSFQIFFNGIIANGTIIATPRTRTGN